MSIICGYRFTPSACALAVAAALASTPVAAFEFGGGDFRGSFDTTVSLGASWRLQDPDPELVGITNGGTARSVNEDNGNLNYEKKDTISAAVKLTHDIALDYKRFGAFLRGTYFYDHAAANQKRELGPQAEDQLIFEADLLDAYVHGGFDIGRLSTNVRVGRQVVSWGESTFIINGINVINAIDVRKLRVPGAELKEALVASPMLWVSQQVSQTTTLEGVILTDWEMTRLDPKGSYFSTTDIASDDGDRAFLGFGRRFDDNFPIISPLDPQGQQWVPRAPDRDPEDHGQYGFAVRQFMPWLNNTEVALYYVNYHSRTPFASGIAGSPSTLAGTGTARYFLEFPEDIRMTGVSFNTSGPWGIAVQGEFAYRPNQPVQLSTTELLLAGLGLPSSIPTTPEITGYRRVKVNQAQMTLTKIFGPTLGADQLALVGEAGFTYQDLTKGLFFNGPGAHLPAPGSSTLGSNGSNQPGGEGFQTRNSWGYRLLTRWDFNNAIGAATLSPRIGYAHDVHGVSSTFNQGVKAVTVGLTYNLRQVWTADIAYTGFWGGRTYAGTDPVAVPPTQSASYASSANPNKDRDFLSVSLSYAF